MNIAVLGLGFMGSTHLKAFTQIPGVRVVAVASTDETQLSGDLSGVQGNIGGPGEKMDFSGMARYRDALEAARDPHADAVDICLPTALHEQAALAALRAGKHVLVEKPMALDGAAAGRMIAEADRAARILMVAQVVRFMPPYRAAAEALAGGALGPVRSAIFRRRCAAPAWSAWLSDPAQSGGGVFDLLVHDIDYCVRLFGLPQSLAARGYVDTARGIDWIAAELQYPSIGAVVITGGWHHPKAFPFSMEYTIVTDGGTLEYSSAGVPPTLYGADGKASPLPLPDQDGYQREIEYFVNCVRQGQAPALCPPAESAAAVQLARWITESRERNGECIPCRI